MVENTVKSAQSCPRPRVHGAEREERRGGEEEEEEGEEERRRAGRSIMRREKRGIVGELLPHWRRRRRRGDSEPGMKDTLGRPPKEKRQGKVADPGA